MSYYRTIPATMKHIADMWPHMRMADQEEIWSMAHMSPLRALTDSVKHSPDAMTGLADETILCMFGVARQSALSMEGCPWLLTTDAVGQHGYAFAKISRDWITKLRGQYSYLSNFVDSRHHEAVKWLRWLGFTIHDAKPFGPDNIPFHLFDMRI